MNRYSCIRRLRGLMLCGAAVILPLAAQAQGAFEEVQVSGSRPIAES